MESTRIPCNPFPRYNISWKRVTRNSSRFHLSYYDQTLGVNGVNVTDRYHDSTTDRRKDRQTDRQTDRQHDSMTDIACVHHQATVTPTFMYK